MRRGAALALAVLALLPISACQGGDGGRSYVLDVRGRARLAGGTALGAGEHRLQPGQEVTLTSGTGVLQLPGGSFLELRAGIGSHADSRVHVAPMPTLVAGDALVVARRREVRVRAGAAVATVDGAGRVSRSTGATLAMYAGAARLDALGRTLPQPVRAFRQVAVSDTGALPRRPVPLVYDRDRPDPWDARYLGDAIDLGDQLERRSRALDRQLAPPTGTVTPGYVRAVVPALRGADGFDDALVDGRRSVGETVVGASIARGGPGSLAQRWRSAFSFRSEGADWGLVAVDQRAQRSSVFGILDGVLDRSPATTVRPGASTTTTTPTSPTTPTTPGPSTPPPTSPPPTTPPPSVVPQPLGNLVGGLIGSVGGLLGPTPP